MLSRLLASHTVCSIVKRASTRRRQNGMVERFHGQMQPEVREITLHSYSESEIALRGRRLPCTA